MKEVWPIILGAVLALAGSYLSSRWQAKHQRDNTIHSSLISLYVDLIADCRARRRWLENLTEEYWSVKNQLSAARYEPPVPVDARVDLLAPQRVKDAWDAMDHAFEELSWKLREDLGYPQGNYDYVSGSLPQWKAAVAAVEVLNVAVRADTGVPRRRSWWRRVRGAVGRGGAGVGPVGVLGDIEVAAQVEPVGDGRRIASM